MVYVQCQESFSFSSFTGFSVVTHQATVAERFMLGLHTITGNAENLLARRPFFVFWFMGQIHRCVLSWLDSRQWLAHMMLKRHCSVGMR